MPEITGNTPSVVNYGRRLESFTNTLRDMTNALKCSRYAYYFEMLIEQSDGTFFALGTTQGVEKNYFMQFDMDINGSGQANSFSVSLVYVPKPWQSPNFLESVFDGVTYYDRKIYLRFGYSGVPQYDLRSPWYECILTDYSISIRDNYVYYTINGVSSLTQMRESKLCFNKTRKMEHPLWLIEWACSVYLKDYQVVYDDGIHEHTEQRAFEPMYDVNIFEYFDTICALVTDKDDPTAIYWWEVSDVQDDKTIFVHRTSMKDYKALNIDGKVTYIDNQALGIVFDWGGNATNYDHNTLIFSFETQYKGSVNLATGKDNNNESLIVDRYSIDSSGKTIKVQSPRDIHVADRAQEYSNMYNRQWTKAVNWTYEATMEVMGIPNDIPIGAILEINPIFYTQKHFTSGFYMITGAKTYLNESGFKTTLNLIRYADNDSFSVHQYVYDRNGYDYNRAMDEQKKGEKKLQEQADAEAELARRNQEVRKTSEDVMSKIKITGYATITKEPKKGATGEIGETNAIATPRLEEYDMSQASGVNLKVADKPNAIDTDYR